jgi:hypothetical protein
MNKSHALVLLAAALIAAGCGKVTQDSVRVDPALSILVPPDTTFAAGIKLDKLRSTPIYKKYIESSRNTPMLDDFAKRSGLDPRKDLWELLFVSNGKDSVALARGKFSESGMEPKLEREGAQRFNYKGYTLFGNEEYAVAFFSPSVAVAGPTKSVRSVIDQRNTRRGRAGFPIALNDRINKLEVPNQFWMAGDISAWMPQMDPRTQGNMTNLGQFAKAIENISLSADLTEGIRMQMDGDTPTPQDAKRIHDAFRGLMGFARLNTDKNSELMKVYDDVNISMAEKRVHMDVEIPNSAVDELMKLTGRR